MADRSQRPAACAAARIVNESITPVLKESLMSNVEEIVQPERNADPVKRRVLTFILLLAVTLAGAVTARMADQGGVTSAGGTGTIEGETVRTADGSVRLSARLDRTSVLEGSDGVVKLELTLEGGDEPDALGVARTSTDLVVVLDRSGSMQGAPLAHALASVRHLITSLTPADRFALITYDSSAQLTIPLGQATREARDAWLATVASIGIGGGTNMSSGLDLASAQVANHHIPGRAARIVLVSDGHANEGDPSREGLVARAARAVPGEYVMSTVGVGDGFDESLMTALADAGTGNFYFVRSSDELGDIFASEFASARRQLASALDVEIRPGSGVQVVSAAGYPLRHAADRVDFNPGALFAGQQRRIWITFRVPTEAGSANRSLADISLHFMRHGESHTLRLAAVPEVALVSDESEFLARLDHDAWATAVAEDEIGELKQEVSRALQSNRPAAAAARMRAFSAAAAPLNAHIQSPAVASVLGDVAAMQESVDRAVKDQDAGARNELSKKYSAEGYDQRRPGAKYSSK
jgi:Ca-activated chloride channel family protein